LRIDGREGSDNIEDRRGSFGRSSKKVGGIGGIVLVAAIAYFTSGGDMNAVLNAVVSNTTGSGSATQYHTTQSSTHEKRYAKLVSVVLKDTEDIWSQYLQKYGVHYRKPILVMYRGSTHSGCGEAKSAMGPFYCPADQKVYLDLGFFDELQQKFGAKGDFAEAYVIAHEIAHHVQDELGILSKVHKLERRVSKKEANRLSVKTELQADCFSGVWAKLDERRNHILEKGDIDEALNAATQIGDDTLQKRAQGYVVPDSFTHGTSQQRKSWFYRGFKSGDIRSCDTFKAL
jgi:predicted metalloprotease